MAPQIKEFDAPQLGLQPSEIGVESTAGAARRVGAFYNQTGQILGDAVRSAGDQAVAYEDHIQITAGAQHGAEIVDGLNQDWNATAKGVTDPKDLMTTAAKWREETLEPALAKFSEGFTTQKSQAWAEHFVDQYRQHAFQKTAADMSSLAADVVHTSAVKTVNTLSNAVYNDPSTLDFSRDTLTHSITGLADTSPALTPDVANRVKTELGFNGEKQLVHSAIAGAIAKGGDWQKIADKYPQYIDRAELERFVREDRASRGMDEAENRAVDKDQRRKATAAFHNDANQWELATLDDKGNPTLPSDAVQNLKDMANKYQNNADPARINAMVHRVQELGRSLDETQTINLNKRSDATERQLYARMQLPDGDPNKLSKPDDIHNAYTKDNLTFSARDRLLKNFTDDKTPQGITLSNDRKEFFKSFASTIDPGRDPETGAGASPIGSQKLYQAQQDARREEAQWGHEVYDPRSPHFFGKPENIAKYRYTLADKAAYAAQLKADQSAKPSSNLGTITGIEVKDAPPRPAGFPTDAAPGPDGKWYVVRDGKKFRVDPK